jgi:hypothetical protein
LGFPAARRLSQIYYLHKFFDYPVKLSAGTLGNLGRIRVVKSGLSYALVAA